MSNLIEGRLREAGGAARRAALVKTRRDAAHLADAIGSGTARQVTRGVYALPGTASSVVTAAVHNARVGCVSALSLLGVAVLQSPDEPHVSVTCERGTRPSRVRERFPAVRHREHAVHQGPIGVTAASALARALVCRPAIEALVSVDDALRQRLVTIEQIHQMLPQTATHARAVLTLADAAARSPLETVARLALRGAGLDVRTGVTIPMVGEVDLVVEGRVVVELDGYAFHSDRAQFAEDRRRDRELVRQGYIPLRFTADDVLRDPQRLVDAVLAALAARPIPPGLWRV